MGARRTVGELLLEAGMVSSEQLAAASHRQAAYGGRIGRLLVNAGVLREDALARFLAERLRLPLADLTVPVADDIVRLVPADMARRFGLFPTDVQWDGNVPFLVVAMADPTNHEALEAVKFKTGHRVAPAVATESGVDHAINAYHARSRQQTQAAEPPGVQFAGVEFDLAPPAPAQPQPPAQALGDDDDIPVVTGVLSPASRLPFPGVGGDIVDLVEVEEPEPSFTALAPPLSTMSMPLSAVPPADHADQRPAPAPDPTDWSAAAASDTQPGVARGASNVRSTGSARRADPGAPQDRGSPETEMAKTPDALAAAPFCPDCGATRLASARFCPHCGCSFTGASRAKGAPPPVAPATRPMMPAVKAAPIALAPGAPLDVDLLEGLNAGGKVIALRPRTAAAANVDEPALLAGKDAPIGLGVTRLVPSVVTDAARPDEPAAIAGVAPPASPVAGMHLHRVTEAMARVDDVASLGAPAPAAGASAPAAAPRAPATPTPTATATATGAAAAAGLSIEALEGISRTSVLTASAALVDDDDALAKGEGFRLALGVTHMAPVHADAALVDDPLVLGGGQPEPVRILRAVLHRTHGAFASVDDAGALGPRNLAREWADAAERPIPRKDNRAAAAVPRSREILTTPPPPPSTPPPEPQTQYVPAAPPQPAGTPAPWAAFSGPAPGNGGKAGPGLATMIMSLDDVDKQKLSERLREKAAEEREKTKK